MMFLVLIFLAAKYMPYEATRKKNTKNNNDIDNNDIELYSWVTEIKSKKEFQVIEILDKNTYLCVNEKNQNGVKFKRFEIEKS